MAAQAGYAAVGASLYIVGLDANVTDSELYSLFSEIGEVVSVEVCEDLSIGLSLRYAYVHYRNPQCAQRALVELNFTPLNGKPMRIMHFHQELSTSEGDPVVEYIKKSCSLDASDQSMGYGSDEEFTEKGIKKHIDKANFVNVFVKNLCESTTEEDLKYTFGEFGLVSSAVVMKNEDGTSKCFGFVNFENAEDAARAVESLNGQIIGKKKWFVARAQKKYERQQELKHDLECVKYAFDNRSNLFVKNLDRNIDDEKLKEFFSPFGSVMSCRVLRDETGNSTKRGLVAFSSAEEASDALSAMNGKVFAGKPLFVAIAQRKEDRRPQLQNSGKKIDHPETFSSSGDILSCKVAKYTSGHLKGYGFVQFSGEVTGQEAIGELERTIGKFNGVITKLSGIIEEFNGTVRELNGLLLEGKQVNIEHYLTKEIELLVDKANFTFVFVKNFCESATEEDLKNIFGEFGLVTDTAVMRNEDGTSKCLGFVNFKNAADAARAVESLNGQRFDEKKMHSWRVQKKLERELELKTSSEQCVKEAIDKHSNNLYVKNLNDSISDENLKELFSCFGLVTSCKVLKDREGRSKGSGFVAFSSPEEASRALGEMNGRILLGKPIRVALAQRKEDSKARLQNLDKEINHKAAHEALLSSVDTGSCEVARDATDRSMEFGSCKVEQKSFKRELRKEYQSESCVNEDDDKGSNHSIPHGKLSEVFPPVRSFESHKMMPDMNGVSRKRGFTTLSAPKQAYESLYEESPFHVAQSQRKEDRRSWLQGQPKFGYGMRSHMHSMSVPLIQNAQQDPHSGSRQTNAGPMQKYLRPAAATKQQMLPRGHHDYHCPPGGVFSVQYERSHMSLCGVVITQSIPVGALASSLANASSLNRGRCWMRYCTRILSSGCLNI